jgi:Fic family protein
MIYETPKLEPEDEAVLDLLAAQKDRLRLFADYEQRRWYGTLRRSAMARAIQGSNSIEGYNATLDDAMAAVEDEPASDERTETARAIKGYRDALTYICQVARDPYFEFSKQFLKSLHFMMVGFDMSKGPGRWRPGPILVVDSRSGETVYTAPGPEFVDPLIVELVDALRAQGASSPLVRGAMAHLNLTLIHPFKDGNGRMARALQTLVIALGGSLHPVFSSIEEWLGENTQAYYDVLAATAQGEWSPHRSALPWVRFCLKAHYQQAGRMIRRNEEYDHLFTQVVRLAEGAGVHERSHLALFDAALGFRVTNQRYRAEAEVSELVASRDLKGLVDLGLLVPQGEKRGRHYLAGETLRRARAATRAPRSMLDPYDLVRGRGEPGSA